MFYAQYISSNQQTMLADTANRKSPLVRLCAVTYIKKIDSLKQ